MKNTVVLIDTNVFLNYITNREDAYLEQSVKIVEMCAKGEIDGYIAFHSLSTLWYVLRKKSVRERRENLRDICKIFSVAAASQVEIVDAIEKDSFEDFEDCLQDKCAKEVGARVSDKLCISLKLPSGIISNPRKPVKAGRLTLTGFRGFKDGF